MAILKLLVGLVVVFLLVAFAIANMEAVAVSFYFYKPPAIPLFVIIFISVLVGVMLAWILVIGEQISLRSKVRAKDKRIKELERELEELEKRLVKVSPQEEKGEEVSEEGEVGSHSGEKEEKASTEIQTVQEETGKARAEQ